MDKQQQGIDILSKYNLSPNSASYGNIQAQGNSSLERAERIRAIAAGTTPEQLREDRGIGEKILDFTGGKEIAQGLGAAFTQRKNAKMIEEQQSQQFDLQNQLITRIKEKRAIGEDTSRLEDALTALGEDIGAFAQGADTVLNPDQLTGRQVIGDALQLGTTIAGAGTLPGQATKIAGANTFVQGALQGAKTGAISGTGFGAATGLAQGLQGEGDAKDVLGQTLGGAAIGGISGGIIGSIIGGVSGSINGRKLRNEVLNAQIQSGEKAFDPNKLTPSQSKAIEIAKTQGFDQVDAEFMLSMSPEDKLKAARMIDIAEKATKNKRVIERPIDVVGDSMVDRIKYIQKQNSQAGKAVNEVAKSLKGQAVDANAIAEQAQNLIDDLNITRTPTGKLNFDNSVFKNTPSIQKKLNKFITEIPTGQADAYDVHIFKKSIDELVDFGTQGEGLKGNSERILKALRATADDVLDNTFDSYNKANTDFRITKDVLDAANDLFGKKTGITSKERGGQLLRSVFSNNTQRPRVMKLVEDLDLVSKQYGGEFTDNLLDQALFTEIIEDVYGTQATTSLQGQVQRAVSGTQRVIEGVRNPIKGIGDAAATLAEKSLGISDENKRKILYSLIR